MPLRASAIQEHDPNERIVRTGWQSGVRYCLLLFLCLVRMTLYLSIDVIVLFCCRSSVHAVLYNRNGSREMDTDEGRTEFGHRQCLAQCGEVRGKKIAWRFRGPSDNPILEVLVLSRDAMFWSSWVSHLVSSGPI